MKPARITKFEVQGFRAFHTVQTLEIDAPVIVIWGPNSQGKTSLAEAFEFLFSGKIVRRELMASSQDEFADALRNAHMPASTAVFVWAHVVSSSGACRVVCRTLVADYSKKQDCLTRLEIDGSAAPESALHELGFVLSHPPLSAPVLAQRTLGYLFSARPQERATYFRALLEVSDLEAFRTEVAALEGTLNSPDDPWLTKLAAAVSIPLGAPLLQRFASGVPSIAATEAALDGAVRASIEMEGIAGTTTSAERLVTLIELLANKRSRTFPVKGFDRKPPPVSISRDKTHAARLNEYVAERAKVDQESRRLTGLFKELLKLPAVDHAHNPIDCPVCGTTESLTPTRLALIRKSAADTEAFQKAEAKAVATLQEIGTTLDNLATSVDAALPFFMQYHAKIRRQRAFQVERMKLLLEQEGSETLRPWLAALRPFVRAQHRAAACITSGKLTVTAFAANPETLMRLESVEEIIVTVNTAIDDFASAARAYEAVELPLTAILKKAVDRESLTAGWQELIDLEQNPITLAHNRPL